MKKFFLSIVSLFLLGAATTMASNVLVIQLTNGLSERFVLLNEQPTISFSGDKIVVNTSTSEHEYAMAAVNYFYYESAGTTDIEETVTPGGMNFMGDHIALSGLPAGSDVCIYGVGGQLYLKTVADADGNATIDLTSLLRGVYIVKANNISTKIAKK